MLHWLLIHPALYITHRTRYYDRGMFTRSSAVRLGIVSDTYSRARHGRPLNNWSWKNGAIRDQLGDVSHHVTGVMSILRSCSRLCTSAPK